MFPMVALTGLFGGVSFRLRACWLNKCGEVENMLRAGTFGARRGARRRVANDAKVTIVTRERRGGLRADGLRRHACGARGRD